MHSLTGAIVADTKVALKRFGTYSFDDKGPGEVMSLDKHIQALQKLTPAEAALVLFEVAHTTKLEDQRGLKVASYIVVDLQDWDALFEVKGIDNLLNGEMPES